MMLKIIIQNQLICISDDTHKYIDEIKYKGKPTKKIQKFKVQCINFIMNERNNIIEQYKIKSLLYLMIYKNVPQCIVRYGII